MQTIGSHFGKISIIFCIFYLRFLSICRTAQEEIRHANNSILLRDSSQQPIIETIEVYDTPSSYYTYTIEKNQTRVSSFKDLLDSVQVDNTTYNLLKTNVAIYIYSGLIVAAIVITLARALLFFKIAMKASKRLHSKMFHALLKAPMRFFDTNPSGRVLNRFSKDMGAIDEILPRVMWDAIQVMSKAVA